MEAYAPHSAPPALSTIVRGRRHAGVIGLAAAAETRLLTEMGDEGEALLAPSTLDALNEAGGRTGNPPSKCR